MNSFDDILDRCLSETKVENLVDNFLYQWQEAGSLPRGFSDAVQEYWKNWDLRWLNARLTFLEHLQDRIPDYEDDIEELKDDVVRYSKHPEQY